METQARDQLNLRRIFRLTGKVTSVGLSPRDKLRCLLGCAPVSATIDLLRLRAKKRRARRRSCHAPKSCCTNHNIPGFHRFLRYGDGLCAGLAPISSDFEGPVRASFAKRLWRAAKPLKF
jgi:hypothetical protein